jgi:hypothetical protein
MFIKKFDMLSPPITLYFRGDDKHPSIFSGILTFVAYTIVFVFGVYYALEFINKENPTAYFFNRYIDDAGSYPVNASSMFNFIQLVDTDSNEPIPLDFEIFRIMGFDEAYADSVIKDHEGKVYVQRKFTEFNHWLYGPCNNESDTEGIGYLIDHKYYEQSACIRRYYDKAKNKYFNTGESGFRWPIVEKGTSNPDRTFYGIIIAKCNSEDGIGSIIGATCKDDDAINNAINKNSVIMQLIDQYADVLNYEMPFKKYFYSVTTALTLNNYIINHLNFNPAKMVTHNGIFFDNVIEEPAYFFVQNEKQTIIPDEKAGIHIFDCLLGFYFWMQNTLQYYERNYKRLQDILSDIGGISSIVLTAAEIINAACSGFIILLDTEDLVLSKEKENYTDKDINISHRPTIFRKAKKIVNPPRRQYNNYSQSNDQQQSSSNYQRLMKDGVDVYHNDYRANDEKAEQYKNLFLKRKKELNNYFDDDNRTGNQYNQQSPNKGGYRGGRGGNIRGNNSNIRVHGQYKRGSEIRSMNKQSSTNGLTTEKKEDENQPLEKQKFNYFSYIKYMICCGKNNPKISYYEEFRNEIISEENIVQYHLDIYKLLKACNIENKSSIMLKPPPDEGIKL